MAARVANCPRIFVGVLTNLTKHGGFNDWLVLRLIIDPESGEQTGSVEAGDATGVCFAQRKPINQGQKLVSIAP